MKPHQQKYYGSLFVILFLIVGTVVLLANSGENDLTGMATTTVQEGGSFLFEYLNSDGTLTKQYGLEYDASSYEYTLTDYSGTDTILIRNTDFTTVANYAMNLGEKGDAQIIVGTLDKKGINVYEKSYKLQTVDETYVWPSNDFTTYAPDSSDSSVTSFSTTGTTELGSIGSAIYDSDTATFTITTTAGKRYEYKIVPIGDTPYAKWEENGITYYTDDEAIRYTMASDGSLVRVSDNNGADPYLMNYDLHAIPALGEAFAQYEEDVNNFEFGESDLSQVVQFDEEKLTTFAKNNRYNLEDIIGEETAINAYLNTREKNGEDITYDVTTGHYTGTMNGYEVSYHEDNIGIKTSITVQKQEKPVTLYKDTSTIPPSYYYVEGTKRVPYKPDEGTKSAIRKAENVVEDVEDDVQRQMDACKRATSDTACQLTYTTADGRTVRLDATARQEAYMKRLYEEQEQKVKGLVAGWLNNAINEWLGGWSRGVPAGICAHIFGLEYYKQDGWTRVAMNASAEQLQSQLIANSRTIIIEGEKEEITEDMYRYAYTIKLLANQTMEWQTYLYNSCTAETSVDSFYDYGSLAAAGYFAFHYAGAGTQDMIFECEQETCIYDQACVAIADGTEPTCVSLVHGAGFETPVAGNEYDCAVTG